MDKIQAGKYVELVYEIFVVNGEEQTSVFKFNAEHPDAFVFGMDLSLIEGFQNHIMGLEQGEKFDFTLQPQEAFGMKNPELIYELEKEIFHVDGKFDAENIRPGAHVPMMTQEGMRIEGQVIKVTDDTSWPVRPCATAALCSSCVMLPPRSSTPSTTVAAAAVTSVVAVTAATSTARAATAAVAAVNPSLSDNSGNLSYNSDKLMLRHCCSGCFLCCQGCLKKEALC